MKKVQIIGAGQLGSRHLQSLKSMKEPLQITVVDPNEASLNLARERYTSIGGENHPITYSSDLQPSNELWDLVIVATNSNVRRTVVEKLLTLSPVKNLLLEKILFNNFEDYQAIEKRVAESHTRTWVNCCMRQMPIYRMIREKVQGSRVHLDVCGSQYGLITNSIHYFDYLAFLTGESKFKVDTSGLDREPVPSKRKGFLEFHGTLTATTPKGSSGRLTHFPEGNLPYLVQIQSPAHRFIVRETEGKAWTASAADDWKWSEIEVKIPYQSQLTAELANQIFTTGQCPLPELRESTEVHLSLLQPLGEHLKMSAIKIDSTYPFT